MGRRNSENAHLGFLCRVQGGEEQGRGIKGAWRGLLGSKHKSCPVDVGGLHIYGASARVCVCVGALRGTRHWFTHPKRFMLQSPCWIGRKALKQLTNKCTQGHTADLLVTLLEFKAGLFNPGVCDPYNLVFWEKLRWKAADSCFLLG